MITGLAIKVLILIFSSLGIFTFGFFKGKKSEKIKQLKATINNVQEVKKRKNARRNDSNATIRKRMSKFIRK